MVGAVRFELTTSCTRNKRASQTTLRPDTDAQNASRRTEGNAVFFATKLHGALRQPINI